MAAEVLRKEIEQLNLLPRRHDFKGFAHSQSIADYERQVSTSQPSLVSIIERLNALLNQVTPAVVPGLPLRIFTSRRLALDRSTEPVKELARLRNAVDAKACESLDELDKPRLLIARELGRRLSRRHMLHKNSMQSLELHCRILGHLSSVFCVAFDRTGRFIITGADDNLVKVWSATSGLLRFTLRGHSAEITDMTVSDDNTLLATGSVDKTVRVWCLQTAASLALFRSHTAMVTLISFLPFVDGDVRYLVSTGRDCIVNFYRYAAPTRVFEDRPLSFHERTSTGSRVISSCHSPGGNLVVVGDTHHFLRMYRVWRDRVEKIHDIQAHTDKVDSLVWAHGGLRFASGSHDGLAKVWHFEYNEWTSVVLDAKMRDERPASSVKNAYKVTMLCWSLEDDYVVTSGSDHVIRVWDSTSGQEIRQLLGHKDEAFVLTAHPVYREYMLSAGHDGFLMVWDIYDGTLVKRHQNQIDTRGNLPLFDFAISPEGTLVAAVDSHGHLSIFGVGTNQRAKMMPKEQFFHTDYMSVISDPDSGFTVDEEMELAPHLLPPPNFVDADGVMYADEIQRLVPGRDSFDPEHPERMFEPIWLKRVMVDKLPSSTVEMMNARLTELREVELNAIEREQKRVRVVVRTTNERVRVAGTPRDVSTREQVPALPPAEEIEEVMSADSSEDSTFTSTGQEDEDSDEEEDDSLETTDDSSDSDYCERQPRRRREDAEAGPNSATSARGGTQQSRRRQADVRTRRRVIISSEDDEGVTQQSPTGDADEPGPSMSRRAAAAQSRRRRQARRATLASVPSPSTQNEMLGPGIAVSGEDSSPGPSTSAGAASSSQAWASGGSERAKRRAAAAKHVVDFPTWMRLVQPLKFPYVAQLDDEVVYFRQGHELYLQSVAQQELYPITARMHPLAELNAEEFCIVDEVKYSRKPFRLTTVRLARIDENGVRSGLVFSVKYHDMENVPDFIILRHLYNESVSRRYQPGDRIETILDNHWWTGTVDKKEAHDEENYPRSNWYCLTVKWDTGEDEKMSPWDVQPLQQNRRSRLATEAEQLQFSAFPFADYEWVGAVTGVDACCNRLLDALEQLKDEPDIRPFAAPVNLEEYPEYSWNVDYPIDLQTIEQRARNKFYRRLRSCEQDIRYIAINASIFNEPRSVIVRNSRVLVETLIRYLRNAEYSDARALFDELKAAPESELVEYNRRQRLHCPSAERRHFCSGAEGSGGLTASTVADEVEPEWMTECIRVLCELFNENSASHFMDRSNNVRQALEGVYEEGCDDLQTIFRKTQNKCYSSPLEVKGEVEKLMQTCRSALDNKRSPVYRDSLTFSGLFNSKMAPILAKWQRMQQRAQSPDEAVDGGGRHLRHRPLRSTRNLHVYNTRSRNEPETRENSSSMVTSASYGRASRLPTGYYRDLNNGLYAERLDERSNRGERAISAHSSSSRENSHSRSASLRSGNVLPQAAAFTTTDSEQVRIVLMPEVVLRS
ncbi:unnamed protein product [Toxocara canis]|uniref:Bromo domain-containing protein n=1 Tax=Toxocara canis TaxID=6265 RepID=A0A183UEI2_TOXCA|nr:unnamed protein product [Toxocara canis]